MIKKSFTLAFAIYTCLFTFIPERCFDKYRILSNNSLDEFKHFAHFSSSEINVMMSRLICYLIIWIVTLIIVALFLHLKNKVVIKGNNYTIVIEYGDILNAKKGKKVVNFDECFTTQVGTEIADINNNSICGQFLLSHMEDIDDIRQCIKKKTPQNKSKYKNRPAYQPGTIIQYQDFLLMSFAKLDEKGKGCFFSRDEYIDCLMQLWEQIMYYYADEDVCVPILGAGTTVINETSDASISQQDLLDLIIWSYRLSPHKIKNPYKLHIVCNKHSGFSINKISEKTDGDFL